MEDSSKAVGIELGIAKFLRLLCYSAMAIYLATIAVVVAILRHDVWHLSLLRFMRRVWADFVTYHVGSTSPGFVSSIAMSALGIILFALYIWQMQGREAMRTHITETAALGMLGLVTTVLLVYGTQFAWEVAKVGYQEHVLLATANRLLTEKNKQLASTDALLVDPSAMQ